MSAAPTAARSLTPTYPSHQSVFRIPTKPQTLPNFRYSPIPLSLRSTNAASRRRIAAHVFISGESQHFPDQLDALLDVTELLCIAPPAVCSIGWLVGSVIPGGVKLLQVHAGSRVFVVNCLLVVAAVAVGAVIRRRQWRRICGMGVSGAGVGLMARIEKVEEDVRSSGTVVRVLSRQLEKLGIRLRVTRKALKEPIAETAALSQKNSEATRALAMQEDILEKELGEIQKVLLAMQEQQRKQLELILAIGKAGKLFDTPDQARASTGDSIPKKEKAKPLEIRKERHAGTNDRA